MKQLFNLMIEVMLPLTLLVAAGAMWPRFFADTPVDLARTLLNGLSMYRLIPSVVTALLLANRLWLDSSASTLLIGWSAILFWVTLPLLMPFGLVRGASAA